jgi:hypothetical protein
MRKELIGFVPLRWKAVGTNLMTAGTEKPEHLIQQISGYWEVSNIPGLHVIIVLHSDKRNRRDSSKAVGGGTAARD